MKHNTSICHLQFLKAGLMTTIQDAGRPHLRAWGVPSGGYLDRNAAQTANALLGNEAHTPVLEMTLQGPSIQFSANCQIALTGTDLSATLDGNPVPRYESIQVKAGNQLRFGRLIEGCRAYLAVSGQWKLEKLLDSHSPLFRGQAGRDAFGWVQKGDQIPIQVPAQSNVRLASMAPPLLRSSPLAIKVLPGPEFEAFDRQNIAVFFSLTFQLSNDCNRMGLRLNGPMIQREVPQEMISSAVLPGTVQITPYGQAIVLLADAQTTGGYPRIVQIVDEDLDSLAQLKPGDKLRFVAATLVA